MTERRVRFTATATDHVAREREWWLGNRDYRDVLPLNSQRPCNWCRLYLRNISCHLYYTHDDERVIIRALWGARRERGPQL